MKINLSHFKKPSIILSLFIIVATAILYVEIALPASANPLISTILSSTVYLGMIAVCFILLKKFNSKIPAFLLPVYTVISIYITEFTYGLITSPDLNVLASSIKKWQSGFFDLYFIIPLAVCYLFLLAMLFIKKQKKKPTLTEQN
jgi:hypothetical protein